MNSRNNNGNNSIRSNSKNNKSINIIINNSSKSFKVTCADDVNLLVEHGQVEDLLREERLLPDGEGEAVGAVGRVEDARVITSPKFRLNDALKRNKCEPKSSPNVRNLKNSF
jgi:hypothetical protein